ncbi:CHAT domain-containing protein [Pantoea sp. App145]|uniref:CHAT domain-containing protein n=1 Tax=Pantoea sp. App145 TaxID=3071567 RepID=UPI003A80546A
MLIINNKNQYFHKRSDLLPWLWQALVIFLLLHSDNCWPDTISSSPPFSASQCHDESDKQLKARCLLHHIDLIGDQAAREGLERNHYRQTAADALTTFAHTDSDFLIRGRFNLAWADDPDNSVFTGAEENSDVNQVIRSYQQVCPESEYGGTDNAIGMTALICSVVRLRLHVLNNGLEQVTPDEHEIGEITRFLQHFSIMQSDNKLTDDDARLARRLVVIGMGIAAAERADSATDQAIGYSMLALKVAEAQARLATPDYEAIAFATNIAELVNISGPIGGTRQNPAIQLTRFAHELATRYFPAKHAVVIAINEALANMDIDIATDPAYPDAVRAESAGQARQLANVLFNSAFLITDPELQDQRLKVVEQMYQRLEDSDHTYEVIMKRYQLALDNKADSSAAIKQAASVVASLSQNEKYREQEANLRQKLLEQLDALPDNSKGLAATLYDAIEVLSPTVIHLPPCEGLMQLQVMKRINAHGKKLAQQHGINAGKTAGAFDPQLDFIFQLESATVSMGRECKNLSASSHTDEIITRQVDEFLVEDFGFKTIDQLQQASILLKQIILRDEIKGDSLFINASDHDLNQPALHIINKIEEVMKDNPLRQQPVWDQFIALEIKWLMLVGQVDSANQRLLQHDMEVSQQKNEESLLYTLAMYPHYLKNQTTPMKWPESAYRNLIDAMCKTGDITGAISLLKYQTDLDSALSRDRIISSLTQFKPGTKVLDWLHNLTINEKNDWNRDAIFAQMTSFTSVNTISSQSAQPDAVKNSAQILSAAESITNPLLRMMRYQSVITNFNQLHNKTAADDAVQRAQKLFVSMNRTERHIVAESFFLTLTNTIGLDAAVNRARALTLQVSDNSELNDYQREEMQTQIASLSNHELNIYYLAISGVIKSAVAQGKTDFITRALKDIRDSGGKEISTKIAFKALEYANSLKTPSSESGSEALTVYLSVNGYDYWHWEDVKTYITAINSDNLSPEVERLVNNLSHFEDKSKFLAYVAKQNPSLDANKWAKQAVDIAMRIPERRSRISTLSAIASDTANLPDTQVSSRAIKLALDDMNTPSASDVEINNAFTRLREFIDINKPASDLAAQLDSLGFFARYYAENGRGEQVSEILTMVSSFAHISALSAQAADLISELTKNTSYEQHMQQWAEHLRTRALTEPETVLQEIEDTSSYSFNNETIDVGVEIYELGVSLSRQLNTGSGFRPSYGIRTHPQQLTLISPSIADGLLNLLLRQQKQHPERQKVIARRALEVMVMAQRSAAATAIIQAAVREREGGNIRQLQDIDAAARNWQRAHDQMANAVDRNASPDTLATMINTSLSYRHFLEKNKKSVRNNNREYVKFATMAAAKIANTSQLVKPDEALLMYRISDAGIFLNVVTADDARLFDLSTQDLNIKKISLLIKRIRNSVAAFEETSYVFDFAASYQLYEQLIARAEPLLKGKTHLKIVPDGALSTIPFQILLMKDPGKLQLTPESIRQAPWLVRQYSIEVVPSIITLLMPVNSMVSPDKTFIGFGDPAFPGWQPHGCNGVVSDRRLRLKKVSVNDTPSYSVEPLPDTGCLLHTLAKELGEDNENIILGSAATEDKVKQLSDENILRRYRIISFATHGLMTGEKEVAEPGLVLSPPADEGLQDGYLGTSEIINLSLNADLVILSACNTALGDGWGGSGEAFDGLASAFLFAGARNLYVTHWPLDSHAASHLFSQAIKSTDMRNATGRDYAVALRAAELQLLNQAATPREANPMYWAPVSSVGQ